MISLQRSPSPVCSEPKPILERARKRAAGKILRETLSKRREAYFELLVSGYSIEQIASHAKA
ncbi:MAG: hypothetical protein WCF81_00880, partial [Roseiarcus sp.]